MRSAHLVDPELKLILADLPTTRINAETLPGLRAAGWTLPDAEDCGVTAESRVVPGPEASPDVELIIYRPGNAQGSLPCIYHMHGGGYIAGAAADVAYKHRPLVAALGCTLITVEYRLAPETKFPGPVEDCYAGLRWVMENSAAAGVDRGRVGVMGESAGGGLAAALALLVRDRGEFQLAFQHLIYPMIDDRTCGHPDPNPYAGEYLWDAPNNHFGWSSLLGQEPGSDGVSSYAAAARAEDLAGLPPTFISTGALDLFVDENITYAHRLIRAGVPTELHVYPGATHGFDSMPSLAVAQRATRDSRDALARGLA
jgi:triacylglycerol lipase